MGTACRNPAHRSRWWVVMRRCNYSAFNGYRWTPSEYSLVWCEPCDMTWRTKAGYVDGLPDLETVKR